MSYTSCNTTTLLPIEFNELNVLFRFVDVNVSNSIDVNENDFFFIDGFIKSDAIARINVPRNLLFGLFLFNIKSYDLSNSYYDNMLYAMDKTIWPSLKYSESIVTNSTAINDKYKLQNLKLDFTRYIIKSITDSLYKNGLFKNKNEFITKIVELDTSFNTKIKDIIQNCGTTAIPKNNTTYTNNPCRILLQSILNDDNVLETSNITRKTNFLTELKNNMNDKIYYVKAKRLNSNDPTLFYSNLKLIQTEIYSFSTTFNIIFNVNNEIITNSNKQTFYSSVNQITTSESQPTGTDQINYAILNDQYTKFNFDYGDTLSVRLTYKPINNFNIGKVLYDRSYEIYIDAGLDNTTKILFDSSGSFPPSTTAIINPKTDIINYRTYQANGLNTAFQYIFNNSLTTNPYISPYSYYPTLNNIKTINFTTEIVYRDKPVDNIQTLAEWNLSNNNPSVNWFVSVFTRPRYIGSNKLNPGFDRLNSIQVGYDVTTNIKNFTLTNLRWNYISNTIYTWDELMKININSDSPYGNIEFMGDQQIMSIAILTNNILFQGKIYNVSLSFDDGISIRTITME